MAHKNNTLQPPKPSKAGVELSDMLETPENREDAQDIITIRSRQGEETVPFEEVLRKLGRIT